MVPVADMCDHTPKQHVAWHTGEYAQDDFQFISFNPLVKVWLSSLLAMLPSHDSIGLLGASQ
jgi:hypothetical protein